MFKFFVKRYKPFRLVAFCIFAFFNFYCNGLLELFKTKTIPNDYVIGVNFSGYSTAFNGEYFVGLGQTQEEAFEAYLKKVSGVSSIVTVADDDYVELVRSDRINIIKFVFEENNITIAEPTFVQVPLSLDTPGEIFNIGMRFAGHTFMYDGETFRKLAATCGFDARRVDYQQSEEAELCGLDLRAPDESVSMYFDCYRRD